jgi:hypothetical protein
LGWTTPYYKTFNWAPVTIIKKPRWEYFTDKEWAKFCYNLPTPKDAVRYEHKDIYNSPRWIRNQIILWKRWGRPKNSLSEMVWPATKYHETYIKKYWTPKIKRDASKNKYFMFKNNKLNFWFEHLSVKSRNRARETYLEERTTAWPISQCFNSLNFSKDTFFEPDNGYADLDISALDDDKVLIFSDVDSDKEEFEFFEDARTTTYSLYGHYVIRRIFSNMVEGRILQRAHIPVNNKKYKHVYDIVKNPQLIPIYSFPHAFVTKDLKTKHQKYVKKVKKLKKGKKKFERFIFRKFFRRHAYEWKSKYDPYKSKPYAHVFGLKEWSEIHHDLDKYTPAMKPYPYRNINYIIHEDDRDYLIPEDGFYTDFKFKGDAVGNKKKKYVKDKMINSEVKFIKDDIINLKLKRKNKFLKRRVDFFNKLIFAKKNRKKKYSNLTTELKFQRSFNVGHDSFLKDIFKFDSKFGRVVKIFILDNFEIPLFHMRFLSTIYSLVETGLNLNSKGSITCLLYDSIGFLSNLTDWVVKTILILLNNNFFIYFWHFLARWVHIDYSARYFKFLHINNFNENIFNLEKYNFIFFKLIVKVLFFFLSSIYFFYTIMICFLQNFFLENHSFII